MSATPSKLAQLNIRASAEQKAKLAEAARLRNMTMSQFVLSQSLDAAEETIRESRETSVSSAEYDWVLRRLEDPPRKVAELKALFEEPSIFES